MHVTGWQCRNTTGGQLTPNNRKCLHGRITRDYFLKAAHLKGLKTTLEIGIDMLKLTRDSCNSVYIFFKNIVQTEQKKKKWQRHLMEEDLTICICSVQDHFYPTPPPLLPPPPCQCSLNTLSIPFSWRGGAWAGSFHSYEHRTSELIQSISHFSDQWCRQESGASLLSSSTNLENYRQSVNKEGTRTCW